MFGTMYTTDGRRLDAVSRLTSSYEVSPLQKISLEVTVSFIIRIESKF